MSIIEYTAPADYVDMEASCVTIEMQSTVLMCVSYPPVQERALSRKTSLVLPDLYECLYSLYDGAFLSVGSDFIKFLTTRTLLKCLNNRGMS